MARILLLEDDKALSSGIAAALEKAGHTVLAAYSRKEGERLSEQAPDLAILDINLPDGNGMSLCPYLRSEKNIPVIFLTANDTEDDILAGFRAGCDDYIAKPFSVPVLLSRTAAVLKRAQAGGDKLVFGELTLDRAGKCAFSGNIDCRLTATEYKLLEYLVLNRGTVLSRGQLLERLWDADGSFIDENTLSVHIKRLRAKIDPEGRYGYIKTVFGIGYCFTEGELS